MANSSLASTDHLQEDDLGRGLKGGGDYGGIKFESCPVSWCAANPPDTEWWCSKIYKGQSLLKYVCKYESSVPATKVCNDGSSEFEFDSEEDLALGTNYYYCTPTPTSQLE
eukprot:CAMPEP_0183709838 /NCGR_PEP_ID=MMETSP0737-20130205/5803_1 /TAXON_ID=385413 /ORGANISM="Thalassiosira miniscula, Strain CCMP1093" /LENGTH=110 /DNA_ID=CAMNT_0025938039 /DNA_START=64 /DNA_END=396 /DNA_ORIENTATION=-